MSYLTEIQAAATEAQAVTADLTGGQSCRVLGQEYDGTWSAPDAFQQESIGKAMTSNGFRDSSVMVFAITRTQWTGAAPPVNAAGTVIIRPFDMSRKYTVHSVHFEDPFFFVFLCVLSPIRQPMG